MENLAPISYHCTHFQNVTATQTHVIDRNSVNVEIITHKYISEVAVAPLRNSKWKETSGSNARSLWHELCSARIVRRFRLKCCQKTEWKCKFDERKLNLVSVQRLESRQSNMQSVQPYNFESRFLKQNFRSTYVIIGLWLYHACKS